MDLIVNLISAQTIPNLQFLKKFYQEGDHLLFINTPKMHKDGLVEWIIKSFKLQHGKSLNNNQINSILIDPYNDKEIKEKLSNINYDQYEKISVNVTGGTKIMSLAAYDFFKEMASDIFYITGKENHILKLFPNRKKEEMELGVSIDLEEYLICYGFDIKKSTLSGNSFEYTKYFLKWFVEHGNIEENYRILSKIRKKRGKNCDISEVSGLQNFLDNINYPVENKVRLSKNDTRYLSGDWFEEYVYYKVKNELNIEDDKISTGLYMVKNENTNEYDVIFMQNNNLVVIECKTHLINKEFPSLVNDTFYKLSSLSSRLGLFCKKHVFTLNKISDFNESHINRAKDLEVNLVCLEDIMNAKSINDLFKIK